MAVDGRAPQFDGGIVTRLDSLPLGIVVNRAAERFYDEGEDFWPKRYAIWGRLVAQQPDQIAYCIIDQKAVGRFMPSVFPPITAPTIAALAPQIDQDPAVLQRTVEVGASARHACTEARPAAAVPGTVIVPCTAFNDAAAGRPPRPESANR